MLGTIILILFGIFFVLWLLLSALTIFFMIKYNGLSITVWAIIILYCAITLPILISALSVATQTDIDFNALIPRFFIE